MDGFDSSNKFVICDGMNMLIWFLTVFSLSVTLEALGISNVVFEM